MNGSTENRATGAAERSGKRETPFTYAAASRMLPLVRHIVADVLSCQAGLAAMHLEKTRLDRHRRDLSWPERARRYQLDDDITTHERQLRAALGELGNLGVALNRETGDVGFPTMVNKQRAYFSWRTGEEALAHWHYAGETERHAIPEGWTRPAEQRRAKR